MGWFFVGLVVGGSEPQQVASPDPGAVVMGAIMFVLTVTALLYKLGQGIHWILVGKPRLMAEIKENQRFYSQRVRGSE